MPRVALKTEMQDLRCIRSTLELSNHPRVRETQQLTTQKCTNDTESRFKQFFHVWKIDNYMARQNFVATFMFVCNVEDTNVCTDKFTSHKLEAVQTPDRGSTLAA